MTTTTTTDTTMTTTDQAHHSASASPKKRQRHVARSARILSTGISATAILGITAAFGVAERIDAGSQDAEPSGPLPVTPATSAAAAAVDPGFVDSTPVAQFPSPEGTVTLPTGSPAPVNTTQQVRITTAASPLAPPTAQGSVTPVAGASLQAPDVTSVPAAGIVAAPTADPVALPSSGDTVATVPVSTVPVATVPLATVAPIAPAEPPVELTLPPPPSNGSSGGSR